MSRRNEIISMLTAGRSVVRVMVPLIFAGLIASGVLLALNFELAPHAEAVRKSSLEQISRGRRQGEVEAVKGYLFRDRMNGRTWFIRQFRPESMEFDGVHITQQDASGRIVKKWYAARAVYDPRTETWTLNKGVIREFNEAGDIVDDQNDPPEKKRNIDFVDGFRVITGWSETPWRIASAQQEAQHLTVPQLRSYLRYNSDFPAVQLAAFRTYEQHRLAMPFQGLVVVFLAGPLAIVFSRRGVIGGIAAAMLLYAGLLLSTYLFLALGRGDRIHPVVAGWFPIALFFGIGVVLLYFRGSNREFRLQFWK